MTSIISPGGGFQIYLIIVTCGPVQHAAITGCAPCKCDKVLANESPWQLTTGLNKRLCFPFGTSTWTGTVDAAAAAADFHPQHPRRWFCVQLTRFDLEEVCWPSLSACMSESSKHVLNPHLPTHYWMLWSNMKRCSVWSLATIRQLCCFFFFPACNWEWGGTDKRRPRTEKRERGGGTGFDADIWKWSHKKNQQFEVYQ